MSQYTLLAYGAQIAPVKPFINTGGVEAVTARQHFHLDAFFKVVKTDRACIVDNSAGLPRAFIVFVGTELQHRQPHRNAHSFSLSPSFDTLAVAPIY